MTLTALSLFSGVGGFELAFERAGIKTIASVEIDKNARGVLQHRFPDTKMFEDVKKVSADDVRSVGFVPERGIICGGFPCQDLSIAGRRKGLAGSRSGLFFEIVRLADELKPRFLVLENVPGLLSSKSGRDMGAVVGSLSELGYGVAWRVLDAQYFGVAQRRRRVFIVGCAGDDWETSGEILALRQGVSGDSSPVRGEGLAVAGSVASHLGSGGIGIDEACAGHAVINSYVKVVRSGARDEKGELPPEVWAEREVSPTLNAMDNTGESRATVVLPTLLTMREGKDGGGKGPLLSIDKSLTLATGNGQYLIDQGVRRLTPVECERLQGFPDDWTRYRIEKGTTVEQKDGPRYKQMGNAVAVPVVEWIAERLVANS